jgi:hypothetical protein
MALFLMSRAAMQAQKIPERLAAMTFTREVALSSGSPEAFETPSHDWDSGHQRLS